MAKATKVIIVFDDGTTFDVAASSAGSVFLNEKAAVNCGHRPPYNKPPKDPSVAMLQPLTATAEGGAVTAAAATTEEGTACYMVNGVIVCP